MTTAVRMDNLGKIYPRSWISPPVEALQGLSLEIAQGEVFGFIGPNGAGKSTTIKILTGVMGPSTGKAEIFGRNVLEHESRRGLGYVPENPRLYDYLTPYEILRMSLSLHNVMVGTPRQHCMNWLERFGLAHAANRLVRGFSKGMLQRTALAQALSIRPKLLILDEPLSGLDPIGRKDVVDILAEFRTGGGTIFLTSHVLHDVERLADRFGLIHQGQLRAIKSPQELVQEEETLMVRIVGEHVPEGFAAEAAGRWVKEVPRDELWTVLQRIQITGHQLQEVRPTLTLEKAFMRFVGESVQE